MNIPRIVDAIGYIDDDLITAALEDPPRKRHNLMIKWMSVAACLALVMIAGILVPHFLRTATIAESKYKYHVSETVTDNHMKIVYFRRLLHPFNQ